jgi:hypothetical protein
MFEEYKGMTDEESATVLSQQAAGVLADLIEGTEAEILEAARYLADEYLQVGDSLLLISSTTGLPVAKIREQDIWQPPDTFREDGSIVKQPPRIRPDLEGFLVRWHFERAREQVLALDLADRVMQTSALPANSNPQLMTVTKEGRDALVHQLRQDLPELMGAVGGINKTFLELFDFTTPSKTGLEEYRGLTAVAHVRTYMADHKARNFQFDQMGLTRAVIGSQWVKEFARTLSQLTHAVHPVGPVPFGTYEGTGQLWVAGGSDLEALYTTHPFSRIYPVEGARPLVIIEPVGHLVVRNFEVVHRMIEARWEIVAQVEYDMWVNWGAVQALVFTDLPVKTHVAEVV